jgi:thiamine-phosphate pyrophosphorylase
VSLGPELRLIAITDFERFGVEASLGAWQSLAALARPGTLAIDLRDRHRTGRELLELGQRLALSARASGQALIVNDRLDLALLLAAEGLHLGEHGIPTSRARARFERSIVRACHRVEALTEVDAEIVLLSPVVEPRKGNPALGLAALTAARAALDGASGARRVFALGGVGPATAGDCIAAGADGVAAIGAAFERDQARALLGALDILR